MYMQNVTHDIVSVHTQAKILMTSTGKKTIRYIDTEGRMNRVECNKCR